MDGNASLEISALFREAANRITELEAEVLHENGLFLKWRDRAETAQAEVKASWDRHHETAMRFNDVNGRINRLLKRLEEYAEILDVRGRSTSDYTRCAAELYTIIAEAREDGDG